MQTWLPDDCCGKPLRKAIESGALDTAVLWTCPKCGCEWRPEVIGEHRHWTPRPAIVFFPV